MCVCDSYKYRPVGPSVGVHGVSRFFPLLLLSPLALALIFDPTRQAFN